MSAPPGIGELVDAELSFVVDTGQTPVAKSAGPTGQIEHFAFFGNAD